MILPMNKAEYHKYLKSDKWNRVRTHVLSRDSYKCRFCNSGLDLNVHHRSYEYIGREMKQLTDLITICSRCHSLLHVIEPATPKPEPKLARVKSAKKVNKKEGWSNAKRSRHSKLHDQLNTRRDCAASELSGLDAFVMTASRLELMLTFACGLTNAAASFLGVKAKKGWKKKVVGETYGVTRFLKLTRDSSKREREQLGG